MLRGHLFTNNKSILPFRLRTVPLRLASAVAAAALPPPPAVFRVILCMKIGTSSIWGTTLRVMTYTASAQTAAFFWSLSIWTCVRPCHSLPDMCLLYWSSLVHRINISWFLVHLMLNCLCLLQHMHENCTFQPTLPIPPRRASCGAAWCTETTFLDFWCIRC